MKPLITVLATFLVILPSRAQECHMNAEYEEAISNQGVFTAYESSVSVIIENITQEVFEYVQATFLFVNDDDNVIYAKGSDELWDTEFIPGERARFTLKLTHNWQATGYGALYSYNLGQDLLDVCPAVTGKEEVELPLALELSQNYPNPFNPQTTIEYLLPQTGNVRLALYDLQGREVRVLIDGQRPAGQHTVRFDATGLPSGSYVYRIEAGSAQTAKVMVVIR